MDNIDKAKLDAAAKMAVGAARVASGVMTAAGHGMLGSFLKSHHMTRQAMMLGKMSVEGGARQFSEGLEAWRRIRP